MGLPVYSENMQKSCSESSCLSPSEIHTLGATEPISLQEGLSAPVYKSRSGTLFDEAGGTGAALPGPDGFGYAPPSPRCSHSEELRWRQCGFSGSCSRIDSFCSTRIGQGWRTGAKVDQRDRKLTEQVRYGSSVARCTECELLFSISLTVTMNCLTWGKVGPFELAALGREAFKHPVERVDAKSP